MNTFEIDLTKAAYQRCWGLKYLVEKDSNYLSELSYQTGIRLYYLKENYKQIKEIE